MLFLRGLDLGDHINLHVWVCVLVENKNLASHERGPAQLCHQNLNFSNFVVIL